VNLLDILLVIIVAFSVVAGFMAGFARVGIGFIAAICGILFGFWFYGIPAEWIHHYIKYETLSNLLGFFAVLFLFTIAGALLGKLLSTLFKWTGLSWLDRLMGGVFGLVRGSLIAVAFVAVLLAFTPKPLPNWMVESRTLPYAIQASNLWAQLAPNAIKQAFEEGMRDVRKAWEEQLKKKPRKRDQEVRKTDAV
jgi:membrane protein required for colicin V production